MLERRVPPETFEPVMEIGRCFTLTMNGFPEERWYSRPGHTRVPSPGPEPVSSTNACPRRAGVSCCSRRETSTRLSVSPCTQRRC